MKKYSLPKKTIAFMYFWLNYCDENHLFRLATEVIKG